MSLRSNRFEDFYQNRSYTALKNDLYNYTLRKKAILRSIEADDLATLEIGSGMSPVTSSAAVKRTAVYCDISFPALRILKKMDGGGLYVVADCMELPFKKDSFGNVVCSEVLEHVEDDKKAVGEIGRVLAPSGHLIITFPHRRIYFSSDDRFVGHLRRYELAEMKSLLDKSGLKVAKTSKVLGLLEKIIMIPTAILIQRLGLVKPAPGNDSEEVSLSPVLHTFFKLFNRLLVLLARLDAGITPLRYATVLMIKADKR